MCCIIIERDAKRWFCLVCRYLFKGVVTSIVVSINFSGNVSFRLNMCLRKSVESLTYDGMCCISGLR